MAGDSAMPGARQGPRHPTPTPKLRAFIDFLATHVFPEN